MPGGLGGFRFDRTLATLSVGQIVGWGALFYSPLIAVTAISEQEGWNPASLVAWLSVGLVVAALAGIPVGSLLDRVSPRLVLASGALLGSLGIALFSLATTALMVGLSLVIVGLGQSAVLYQAAFTVATRRYRGSLDFPLTVITIAGGLSSAIFAPIIVGLLSVMGWRPSFLVLAGLVATLVPLFWWGIQAPQSIGKTPTDSIRVIGTPTVFGTATSGRFLRLVVALLVTTVGIFSVTFLAIPLLEEKGLGFRDAAWIFGVIGLGQILGRLAFLFLKLDKHPRALLFGVAAGSGVGVVAFGVSGGAFWLLVALAVVLGALRGAHTLVQATAVSVRWGRAHYGALNGLLQAPLSVGLALAPALGAQLAQGLSSFTAMAIVMGCLLLLIAPLAKYT